MPRRNTTRWATDRRRLFSGQFSDFHADEVAIKASVKLFTLEHFWYFRELGSSRLTFRHISLELT